MERTEAFGRVLRVEAERRGMQRAGTVLVMGDGGNWIDPLSKRECLYDQRIVDYYHAAEHLYEAAWAALGKDTPEAQGLAEQLKDHLWAGQVDEVIVTLRGHAVAKRPCRRRGDVVRNSDRKAAMPSHPGGQGRPL